MCGVQCVGVGCVCVAFLRSFARSLYVLFGGEFLPRSRRHAFVKSFLNKLVSSCKKKKKSGNEEAEERRPLLRKKI